MFWRNPDGRRRNRAGSYSIFSGHLKRVYRAIDETINCRLRALAHQTSAGWTAWRRSNYISGNLLTTI